MDTTDNGWDGPLPLCVDCGEPIDGKGQEHGLEGFGHHRRCCDCYERRQRGLPVTGKPWRP